MKFDIVGHRGAMAEAPENTVASFRLACEIGVDEVETDVRISADGQLFMLHDATLDRTAAADAGRGLGPVAELPWSVISSVDVGGGERVPTLQQMYESTASTMIQLEIKHPATLDALPAFFADHRDYAERTMITGFSIEAIAKAAELMPDIRRGIIVHNWTDAEAHPGGADALIKETSSNRIHAGWDGLTSDVVDQLHEAGFEVHGWPTRTKEDLALGLKVGIDGTTSDDPRTMQRWLTELTA